MKMSSDFLPIQHQLQFQKKEKVMWGIVDLSEVLPEDPNTH
jgi:hypothetical protein